MELPVRTSACKKNAFGIITTTSTELPGNVVHIRFYGRTEDEIIV